MKTTIYKTIFLIAIFIHVAANSQAQTPEQQFQKGIIKEEGEGLLKEAIDLYKSVADNANADKVLRAKALYQMGNCYEKLGQQEARHVYEKLVANYTDPQELVANAKRKLSKLNVGETDLKSNGIFLRQLWSPIKDGCDIGGPSPDGRYIVFHNYISVEVGIRDLKTGKEWEITNKGTWEAPSVQYPGDDMSIWSPDSKQIAYPWVIDPNTENQRSELHLVNIDGSNDRVLISQNKFDGPYPIEWSSDGKFIVGLNYSRTDKNNPDKSITQIILISVNDGSEKIITEMEDRRIGNITFSPDGNHIIFSAQTKPGSENYDIYIISTKEGNIFPLISNQEKDIDPIRVPGTNQVLFLSNHAGSMDLFSMNIKNGKLEGEPKIIKGGLEDTFHPNGITENGILYYTTSRLNPDRYIAKLDFEKNEVHSEVVKIVHKYPEKILKTYWSPSLTYAVYLIGMPPVDGASQLKFMLKNLKTGDENEISTDLLTKWYLPWISPQWTVDEMGIIVKAWTSEGENGLFQVDINTGNYKRLQIENIPDLKNWQIYWNWKEPQFSPDRKIIYYTTAVDSVSPGEPLNLIAYSVDKGTERIIQRFEKEITQRIISPDGRFIAFSHFFSDKNSLYVIPVEGQGLKKKIAGFEGNFVVKAIGWTPDNKKVLFTRQSSVGDVEIWAASLENEPPVKLYNADALKAFKGAVDLKIQYLGNDAYLTMKDASRMNELWAADNITQK